MNLKSYIRGIGIGILVTTAIFLVSGVNNKKSVMTDAQVIARAKELGMVESTTLSDMSNVAIPDTEDELIADTPAADAVAVENENVDASSKENATEVVEHEDSTVDEKNETVDDVAEEKADVSAEAEMKEESKEEATDGDAQKAEAKTEESANNNVTDTDSEDVVIVVNPGDGSDRVAKKLFDAGLVPNAYEFDQFLMANGYDRKITTGNHIISRMATGDEIGKNLVSPTK